MKRTIRLTKLCTWTVACVLSVPQTLLAAEPPRTIEAPQALPLVKPMDVKLSAGGEMAAVVRDAAGKPQPGVEVAVLHQGAEVAVAETDDQGRFAVSGLRRGSHVVQVQNVANPVRLWPENAAPPQAVENAVITLQPERVPGTPGAEVSEGQVVEVQQGYQPATRRPTPLRRFRNGISRVFANYPILATTALIGAGIGSGIAIGSSSSPASP